MGCPAGAPSHQLLGQSCTDAEDIWSKMRIAMCQVLPGATWTNGWNHMVCVQETPSKGRQLQQISNICSICKHYQRISKAFICTSRNAIVSGNYRIISHRVHWTDDYVPYTYQTHGRRSKACGSFYKQRAPNLGGFLLGPIHRLKHPYHDQETTNCIQIYTLRQATIGSMMFHVLPFQMLWNQNPWQIPND